MRRWVVVMLLLLPLAAVAITPEADFAQRCAAPGVIVCRGFDDEASLKRVGTVPQAEAETYPGANHQPELDCSVKFAGACALKFISDGISTDPSPAGTTNVWFPVRAAHTDTWVQWMQRVDAGMLAIQPPHWKQMQLQGLDPTATGFWDGIVVTRSDTGQIPIIYKGGPNSYPACGSSAQFTTDPATGEFSCTSAQQLLQQGDYPCNYPLDSPFTGPHCAQFVADTWMVFQVHVHLGDFGVANSTVEAWIGFPGQPMQQYIYVPNYNFPAGGDSSNGPGFTNVKLLPFITGGKTDATVGITWYDNLIVSSKPIAPPRGYHNIPTTATGWYALTPASTTQQRLAGLNSTGVAPDTVLAPVCWNTTNPSQAMPGNDGCAAVISDWCSGALDSTRNRMLLWCGGHHGYAGNEIYAINLGTQNVERLTTPTDCNTVVCEGAEPYPDGKPAARHTYDGLTYLSNADDLFAVGGVTYKEASSFPDALPWRFDVTPGTWSQASTTNYPAHSVPISEQNTEQMCMDYDPVTGTAFLIDIGCLYSYDPTANTFTRLSPSTCTSGPAIGAISPGSHTAIIDPVRRHVYVIGSNTGITGDFVRADISQTSNVTFSNVTTTGCSGLQLAHWPGLAYDPVTTHIFGWVGGNAVYEFNPDTLTCTTHTDSGGPTVNVNGTAKRWSYSAYYDGFVVVNDIHVAASLWLPARSGTPTPSTTLQGQLRLQGTVTVR